MPHAAHPLRAARSRPQMSPRPVVLVLALLGAGVASAGEPPGLEIAPQVAAQYAAWNARDLDGYLAPYWHDGRFVCVTEGLVWVGWEEVHARLTRGYPDPEAAGHATLERLDVRQASDDAATSVEWWTMAFAHARLHGNTVSAWRRFSEGWRAISVCTSVNE